MNSDTITESTDSIRRRHFEPTLASKLHKHPLVGRILASRGITSSDELALQLKYLPAPGLMRDFNTAVTVLADAVSAGKKILIVGDYDADGATSTALACHVLRSVGASVDYLVPSRFKYGYGLSPAIVEVALQKQPDVLLTVDNGIASEFPGKNLCGVGVIFYVMSGLCRLLQQRDWFAANNLKLPAMAEYLDLVAVGTVADVVPLDHLNRILVEQGVRRIRAGQARPGVLALFEVATRPYRYATADDLGFIVGPRLNAAGRLDDMSVGVDCLLADSLQAALPRARELDHLNRSRRQIESGMREDAEAQVSAILSRHAGQLPSALVLYEPDWHEGVIGIVAGRIKEQCHRPVFAFARSPDGMLKGSGRSVPGVHIRDILMAMVAQQPSLLAKFGGHAMAAGATIEEAALEQFRELFVSQVDHSLGGKSLQREWLTDGALSDDEISLDNAALVKYLQPWGQAFPFPTFDDNFEVRETRTVGQGHSRLLLRRVGGTRDIPAVIFNRIIDDTQHSIWRVVYRLDVNRYRDTESLQLKVDYMVPA
jgi:single-stranded-DNA-specific exonuclease